MSHLEISYADRIEFYKRIKADVKFPNREIILSLIHDMEVIEQENGFAFICLRDLFDSEDKHQKSIDCIKRKLESR